MKKVSVRVPATTANLGPGYDILGAALKLYNHFIFQESDHFGISLEGPYAEKSDLPVTQENLVYEVFDHFFRMLGLATPVVNITLNIQIPPGRGLGSSATAIVGGLYAANSWLLTPLMDIQLLKMAVAKEGHPDNVVPALTGGCMLNIHGESVPPFELPVLPELKWILCIPDFELATEKARAVLPSHIPVSDAVFNMSRLATLIAGFYTGDIEKIRLGLVDRLHQPYREKLIPGMQQVMDAAHQAGAIGCVLSGAGPTLLALGTENENHIANTMQATWKSVGISSQTVITAPDTQGAIASLS